MAAIAARIASAVREPSSDEWWYVCYGKLTQHLTVAWVSYVDIKDNDKILIMPSNDTYGNGPIMPHTILEMKPVAV